MQINAANMKERLEVSTLFPKSQAEEKKAVDQAEKVVERKAEYYKIQKTTVERTAGLYHEEAAYEDNMARRVAEIRSKLDELVNKTPNASLLGIKQEGYSINGADVEKIVTVMDQIQVKLAAFGKDYKGTGRIDEEDAKAVLGSGGMASCVAQSLVSYDMPVTEENEKAVIEAYDMASSISRADREQAGYMAANQMEPTIENMYKAEHSGAGITHKENQTPGFSPKEWDQLKPQVEEALREVSIETTEDNIETARWMLEQEIPLDGETLKAFFEVLYLDGEPDAEKVIDNIVQAMAKGKEAREALLTGENYSEGRVEETVSHLEEQVKTLYPPEDTSLEAVRARRQMEEIRLLMTREAGLSLIKKGIEIETQPLEALVEELKEQEREYYKALYAADGLEPNSGKLDQLQAADHMAEALKQTPAYVIGIMAESQAVNPVTMEGTYEAGRTVQAVLQAASETYDTLMTGPDKEYGDSLSKAFRNIDSLLADMGLEGTEENVRAVKILAYNQMELTEENVNQVKELDGEFQYLLKNLTPRVTMHMIEKQINPLNTELHELNDKIEQIKEEIGPAKEESYSEFLWKLDKKQGLSPEERDAYIGFYRLLHQVDRSQGAAIGALVNQSAEITLDHLLTAVRSRKAKGTDTLIDDDFGLSQVVSRGDSITDQLKGFMETFEEEDRSYQQKKQERFAKLSKETEVIQSLAQSGQTVSLDHLEAVHAITFEYQSVFRKLFKSTDKDSDEKKADFTEKLTSKEAMAEGYEEMSAAAEEMLSEAVGQSTASYESLEDLRLFNNTAKLMVNLAASEDYHLPVEVQGEMTAVHLKIVHNKDEAGKVEIEMKIPDMGKVRAEFQMENGVLNGFVMGDSAKLSDALRALDTDFRENLENEGIRTGQISYSNEKALPGLSETKNDREETDISTENLYKTAKGFIETVKIIGSISK